MFGSCFFKRRMTSVCLRDESVHARKLQACACRCPTINYFELEQKGQFSHPSRLWAVLCLVLLARWYTGHQSHILPPWPPTSVILAAAMLPVPGRATSRKTNVHDCSCAALGAWSAVTPVHVTACIWCSYVHEFGMHAVAHEHSGGLLAVPHLRVRLAL